MEEVNMEGLKPSKSDINWVIMDYLVSEGYPAAAEKFAQETNLDPHSDLQSIQDRVRIRGEIQRGHIDEAISLINELDPEILNNNASLHFSLLQLQLIEIIREVLNKSTNNNQAIAAADFLPAIQFATEQLSPRAPTDPSYQSALERTMALMIFPPEKMTDEFKALLDPKLREMVATEVNRAVLHAAGHRTEAKIRNLVRARAWAESQARDVKATLPENLAIGLDREGDGTGVGAGGATDGDPMVT